MKYIPVILPNGSLNIYAVLDGRTPTLEWLQQQVGGYIETVPACLGNNMLIIVNEEGKLKGLPFNDTATDMARGLGDMLVGTVVVMKAEGPELAPLDRDELMRVAAFSASSHGISTRPMETEEDEE